MPRKLIWLLFLLLAIVTAQAVTTEPLVGTWTLSSQTVNGRKVDSDQLTLRVYPVGDALEFAFSVPVNGVHLVSLKFTSVHLDGRGGSVQDVRGTKIGTVQVTKVSPLEYKAVMEGANRPKTVTKMTISTDGKTLTSESDKSTIQVFTRR